MGGALPCVPNANICSDLNLLKGPPLLILISIRNFLGHPIDNFIKFWPIATLVIGVERSCCCIPSSATKQMWSTRKTRGKFGIFDAYESAHQHGGDYGDLAGRCNQR